MHGAVRLHGAVAGGGELPCDMDLNLVTGCSQLLSSEIFIRPHAAQKKTGPNLETCLSKDFQISKQLPVLDRTAASDQRGTCKQTCEQQGAGGLRNRSQVNFAGI